MSDLESMLIRHEGKRNKMYIDSEGIPTIGIGHNLRDGIFSDAVIDLIFSTDLANAVAEAAAAFPWMIAIDQVRQDVLVDMVFNMGAVRVAGFKKTLAAMESGEWETAANEMIDSLWASQVGNRAHELAEMIRSGNYQE